MPREVQINSLTLEELRISRINREMRICRESYKARNKANAKKRKDRLFDTKVRTGDKTQNTPDLRKNAKQSMRIDKEINEYPYLVDETSKYWQDDVTTTLAIIEQARMIIASRKKRIHDYGDDNERRDKKNEKLN